jgi:hypothetical protein
VGKVRERRGAGSTHWSRLRMASWNGQRGHRGVVGEALVQPAGLRDVDTGPWGGAPGRKAG